MKNSQTNRKNKCIINVTYQRKKTENGMSINLLKETVRTTRVEIQNILQSFGKI